MDESNEQNLANEQDLENEEEEISAEYALSDVLDYIFQYLKIKDLSNASLVCQFWRAIGKKEISRRGPERILMPSIFNKEFESSNFHVSNLLSAKPDVAMFFVGPSLRERRIKHLESEILAAYGRQFPHYLVTVGVDETMMDEKVINSCPGLLGTSNGILGLFLPLYNDVNIKVTLCVMNNTKYNISDFLPEVTTTNSKVIFMIFSSPYNQYLKKTLDMIKHRFAQKSYTLWGGVFDDELKAIECNKKSPLKPRLEMLSVCITGSSLDSWSTVIDCRIKKHEVDRKLLEFRDCIKCKRITIGLVCGPRYVEDFSKTTYENMYKNSHELMRAIKKCFPKIQFTGIFNYGYHGHFGVNSTSEDNNQKLSYEMTMSLLIITYN